MSDKTREAPKRRALLQRGAVVLGGALGLSGTMPAAHTTSVGETSEGGAFRLFGRRRQQARSGRASRALTGPPAAYGDLAVEPGAEPVGSFRSNGLGQAGALPDLPVSGLEIQTFELEGGTLFGIGAPAGRDGDRHCAVLGGTGRFSSASGSYVERRAETAGLVEFTFTLKG